MDIRLFEYVRKARVAAPGNQGSGYRLLAREAAANDPTAAAAFADFVQEFYEEKSEMYAYLTKRFIAHLAAHKLTRETYAGGEGPRFPVYLMTVNKDWIGNIVEILEDTIVLAQAAWISETGRFSAFFQDGRTDDMEVEVIKGKFVEWGVSISYIVNASPWPYPVFPNSV